MIETQPINPGIPPGVVDDVESAVDWSRAPVLAAAYILVCVEQVHDGVTSNELFGAWLIDTTLERIRAPVFGGAGLGLGQRVVVRRPGHELNPIAMEMIRAWLWKITGLNDRLEILSPEPDYVPPRELRMNPLHVALLGSMEMDAARARIAARVQSAAPSGV